MIDTRGREIRTGLLEEDSVLLERNQDFSIYSDDRVGNEQGVTTSFKDLYKYANADDRILLNDGQIELIVREVSGSDIITRVECGGVLRNNKGVNLPDNKAAFDQIPSDDTREIEFAANHGDEQATCCEHPERSACMAMSVHCCSLRVDWRAGRSAEPGLVLCARDNS